MQALRLEATCTQDGVLTLRDLPLHRGDAVEVVIFARPAPAGGAPPTPYPLRDEPVTYLLPTEPVADGDWEATR